MNKFTIASAAAALMMGFSTSAFSAMSAADCQAMFQKADMNKDGSLQAEEAKIFLDAMNQAQVQPKDALMVTQDEFLTACQKDAFANIDPATIGTGQSTAAEQPAAATEDQSAEQPAAEQPAAEQPAEQAVAAPAGFMVSDLMGATVYSGSDETIGEIKDVVFSDSGQATHVIIQVGDKYVEVERTQLKIAATDAGLKVVVNASEADLAMLPAVRYETAATTEQPVATDQTGSAQPTTTTETTAATDQSGAAATADQPAETATAEQPATTDQPAAEPQATDQTASTGEPATTDQAAEQPAEQALAIPEGLMVSDLLGTTVYSRDDEAVGKINDMVLSAAAGQKPQVIIGVGGFLGIGEKDVAIDLSQLKIAATGSGLKIVLDASKADLESLAATSPK